MFDVRGLTGEKMDMGRQKRKRNVVYYICGSIMAASLLLITAYMYILKYHSPELKRLHPVFWLETIMLVAFGISWLTKGQLLLRDETFSRGP